MDWIKVSDRLPERQEGKRYSQVACLVYRDREVEILVFNHEHMCWDQADGDDYECDINAVSHWQPLPDAPLPSPPLTNSDATKKQ